jgi:hypothetical protein
LFLKPVSVAPSLGVGCARGQVPYRLLPFTRCRVCPSRSRHGTTPPVDAHIPTRVPRSHGLEVHADDDHTGSVADRPGHEQQPRSIPRRNAHSVGSRGGSSSAVAERPAPVSPTHVGRPAKRRGWDRKGPGAFWLVAVVDTTTSRVGERPGAFLQAVDGTSQYRPGRCHRQLGSGRGAKRSVLSRNDR